MSDSTRARLAGRGRIGRAHQHSDGCGHEAQLRESADAVPMDPLGGTRVGTDLAGILADRAGRGRPLPSAIAATMGEQLSTDLTGVRVHADREADGIARSVHATAFTLGTDIYFTSGAFAPSSSAGRQLLAHELSHVAQGPTDRPGSGRPMIGRADDRVEREADRMAGELVAGRSVRPSGASGAPDGVARKLAPVGPGQLRRVGAVVGVTAVADFRSGEYSSDDETVPLDFIDLAEAIQHTIETVLDGDSANYGSWLDEGTDPVETFGSGPESTGALGAIGVLAGLKGALLGGVDVVEGGTMLNRARRQHDFGVDENGNPLGAFGDSLSRNLGAVKVESGATAVLGGGGDMLSGAFSIAAEGIANAPVVGDVVNVMQAGFKGKRAAEDYTATAKLGARRPGLKRDQDQALPLAVREKRFGEFLKALAAPDGKVKRSDRKRFQTVLAAYRQTQGVPALAAGATDPFAPTSYQDWISSDPDPTKVAARKAWLDHLKKERIKDFGFGSDLREEYERGLSAGGRRTPGAADPAYEQFRNLTKVTKFGQRRKAEVATLNTVEATGHVLDAAGTYSAAGDFGATKLVGKGLKAGSGAYKGTKSLVKRGRRVHKLRTARNDIGYGGTAERGVGWGAKQFFTGNLEQRMKKTKLSIKADGQSSSPKKFKASNAQSDAQKKLLIRRLTLQCKRRAGQLVDCLLSDDEAVRNQAKKILHIIAETNLAGALAKIDDRELDLLYKVKRTMKLEDAKVAATVPPTPSKYTTDHSAELRRRKKMISQILSAQLSGVGG